ncbi:MAG: hypothetical protein ABWX90_01405 [Candidatus Saccharimonadales bacterium]
MRTTEQLPEEDAGEPPSPEPHDNYFNLVFDAHDRLDMNPPYPAIVSGSGEFELRLFDDYENIEIEASLSGSLAEKYRQLDSEGQYRLASHIEGVVSCSAKEMFGDFAKEICEKETVVLINNLPVVFEPINNAMLVGKWDDWEKRKMTITSQCIIDYDQQRLLLGGLAAFLTYLEQQ